MNGAQVVVEALERESVDFVFGYPGGACMPIFDALVDASKLKLVLVRHEQGGTHMADGYARATGKPGVVLVTSGPGATNTVTGLLTAQMDSVPLVVITGQTITANLGKDAFQEAGNRRKDLDQRADMQMQQEEHKWQWLKDVKVPSQDSGRDQSAKSGDFALSNASKRSDIDITKIAFKTKNLEKSKKKPDHCFGHF